MNVASVTEGRGGGTEVSGKRYTPPAQQFQCFCVFLMLRYETSFVFLLALFSYLNLSRRIPEPLKVSARHAARAYRAPARVRSLAHATCMEPQDMGARSPLTTEGAALLSPLLELPVDVQCRITAAVADAVHPQHLCHLASVCAALRVALAELLAPLRDEHQDIKALCVHCGTTLEDILRWRPSKNIRRPSKNIRQVDWAGRQLRHQHAAALGSLMGSKAMAQLEVSWRLTALTPSLSLGMLVLLA